MTHATPRPAGASLMDTRAEVDLMIDGLATSLEALGVGAARGAEDDPFGGAVTESTTAAASK